MNDCETCGTALCDYCSKPIGCEYEQRDYYCGYKCNCMIYLCKDCDKLNLAKTVILERGCEERQRIAELQEYIKTQDYKLVNFCRDYIYDCGIDKNKYVAASFSKGDKTVYFKINHQTLKRLALEGKVIFTLEDCAKYQTILEQIR